MAACHSIPRRDLLLAGMLLGSYQIRHSQPALAATKNPNLLADLPMIRVRLPHAGVGREYVAIQLKIDGKGPYDFIIDTGLTTELITPHLEQSIGISARNAGSMQGLAAGGATVAQKLVELKDVTLCCGNFAGDTAELKLPPLYAVITDFPQEHIDPLHDPVEGMIGMELLSMFDVDFDFPGGRVRFWKPRTALMASKSKLVEIPAVMINETGLIGIRVSVTGAKQPILGFLDCGSTFSCVNWAAGPYLGIPPKTDPTFQNGAFIEAIGVDGHVLKLPLVKKEVTFAGNVIFDKAGKPKGFEEPSRDFKPWSPVDLGVGDLPAFSSILGDGVHPFTGPAALIGLDIISQRRLVLEAGGSKTRARRVFVSPN
jgi:hypothetical protein